MNRNQHSIDAQGGFTLIEMAIVLVILGLMAGVLATPIMESIRQGRVEKGNVDIEAVADGLIGYALLDATHSLPAAVSDVAEDADAWNRNFHYLVDAELVGAISDVCTSVQSADVDDYQVLTPVETIEPVAFFLGSDGGDFTADIVYGAGAPAIIDLRGKRDDLYVLVTLNRFKAMVCAGAAAEQEEEPAEPPPGYVLRLEFDETDQAAPELVGDAEVANMEEEISGSATPDGYALSLDGSGDYYEVPDSADYRLTEFTILGWFRTRDTSISDYEVVTSRQSQSGLHNDRNWWVTVWTNATSQGHVPGDLVFKASPEIGSTHFNFDTEVQTRLTVPHHHDALWHFFAVTMGEDPASPGDYVATLYVSENLAEPLHTGTQTLPTPPEVGPATGSGVYEFFVGRDTYGDRYFDGYIDDIIVYDAPLSASEIEDWYEAVREYYL